MTATTLLKRAADCESSAETYDSSDPYKAGVYRGQSQILKEWAGELTNITRFDKYHRWYDRLITIINPFYWYRGNSRYSHHWDIMIVMLMNKHRFVQIGRSAAQIDGRTVYILPNGPYTPFALTCDDLRPSRLTEIRAWRKLRDDLITEET